MAPTGVFLAACTAAAALIICLPAHAFAGNFEVSGLEVNSPFQTDPRSTANTSVSFTFTDQNTPEYPSISCCASWAVGLSPPSDPTPGTCSDDQVHVSFPAGTYYGVENFQVQISHTYEDDSIGEAPYNEETLFGVLNLKYGGNESTANYECDMVCASCQSPLGVTLIALVTSAVA